MFCRVVHLVQRLHGRADLRAGHLLIEGVDEAVGPRAVLPGDDEGVEVRLPWLRLRPERQAFGQTELNEGRQQEEEGSGQRME